MTSRTFDPDSLSDANLGLMDQAEMMPDGEVSPEASVSALRKRSLADRFLFNDRREPSAISKFVLLRRDLRNRAVFRRIIRRKNGTIRLDWREWFDAVVDGELAGGSAKFGFPSDYFISRRIHATAKTLHLVTTQHTEFLAAMIANCLEGTRFTITHSTTMPESFDHDLYIVACPQMFDRLPPKHMRIIFQLEQTGVSPWFTSSYLKMINDSLAVFDYSLDNIDYLLKNGTSFKSVFYLPIHPTELKRPVRERDIDVLFYGALAKSRRRAILAELGKHHKIRIENNLFGAELEDLLDRTKVVVNIHYYEGALLETTRIAQVLSHGAQVVSEVATDQKRNGFYEDLVSFVPIGDVPAMAAAISLALANKRPAKIAPASPFEGSRFMLLRAFLACGVISFQELWQNCAELKLPSDRIILGMPESLERHDFALAHRLEGAVMFCGLRMIYGWMGCALGYKFLAMLARQQGMSKLAIYEDDADFGTDGVQRLKSVEDYLSIHDGEWDIFSGLLSDLHDDAKIFGVDDFNGDRFVKLDKVIGMVFGIYSAAGLDLIADFRFLDSDTRHSTIDRYLESLPVRCVSLAEPLVDHRAEFGSTIWGNENEKISAKIDLSKDRLKAKVEDFLVGARR